MHDMHRCRQPSSDQRRRTARSSGGGNRAQSSAVIGGLIDFGMRWRSSPCSSQYVSSIVPLDTLQMSATSSIVRGGSPGTKTRLPRCMVT